MQHWLKRLGHWTLATVAGLALFGAADRANAGAILLTGHDVLFHGGQNGFDTVTLDFLRGAGTASEIAKTDYDLAVVGSGAGSWSFTGADDHVRSDYASTTFYDTDDLTGGTASWADVLSKDALIILSHTSCGGCDLSDAGVIEINAHAGEITTAFNAGLDIWGISGADNADYYNFLPAGAVATGAPISGSSGFTLTAAGLAIGLTDVFPNSMINGFPTHNRFPTFDPDFTVFEVRDTEAITIGIQNAIIDEGGIGGGTGGDTGGVTEVPEPGTLTLLGAGLLGLSLVYRRRTAK